MTKSHTPESEEKWKRERAILSELMKDEDETSKQCKMRRKRSTLRCDCCPPHAGENEGRRSKHGAKKPRQKHKTKER